MELIQGLRNKAEVAVLRRSLQYCGATAQPLDQEITARAIFLMETYALSHGLQMADALIGATAVTLGARLVTANDKHYLMIDGLDIAVFRPSRRRQLSELDPSGLLSSKAGRA